MLTNVFQQVGKNKRRRHATDNKNIYHCLNLVSLNAKGTEPVRTLFLHKDTP